jgi:Papain-like cysteine protease AvrRpt2
MTTLYELDKYVQLQRTQRRRKKQPGAAPGVPGKTVAKNGSRAHALSTLAGRRAVAFSRPLDYEVPGIVGELRQPSRMACWATTYTMMVGWRDQASSPIERVLGNVGQKWVNLFKADTGSTAEQEAELFAAAGLAAEPLASYTLESWEGLLRQYGPLAVIIDVDPSDKRAMHMVIVAGIHGDGTADGTTLTIVDPARGDKRPVKFSAFLSQYHQGAARRTSSGRHNQIIHWPKDVKFAGAKGLLDRGFETRSSPPAKAPAPATTGPAPWSRFFQFRKGSKFDIDGPLTYNGKGEVLERTNDYLKFTMKMPAASIFGQTIPAADMVLEATYKKEGKGNVVRATINGQVMEDTNAEIVSSGSKRTIRPNFSGFTGPLPEWITVTPDGDDEIDLDMKIDGRDVDFDLERTSGSSGMALSVQPWSQSFPFAGGTAFLVNGPLSFDGRGRVLERTDTLLRFEINMPPATILNKKIPKLDLLVDATYAKEGSGNKVDFTINGTKHPDANASISTDAAESRRTIVPSIVFPGAKVEMVSFAPDGRDTIDLDVTIDGKDHDFDLEKIKGPAAQSWVEGLARTSTQADALNEIAAFAARGGASRWKIARADLAQRLRDVVNDPNKVTQGHINLCGPAIFFHVYARRDPVGFVRYAAELFEKASAKIGSLKVTAGGDLLNANYASIKAKQGGDPTPVAEWMCMSALRDSENAVLDFEGDPSATFSGMTTPGELADWMRAAGIYNKVSDEGNWVASKGLNHAMALRPVPNRDILMLINAKIIDPNHKKKALLDKFPNHFIQLLSPIRISNRGTVSFDFWSWGELYPNPRQPVIDIKTMDFIDNYYGTVTGEV